MTTMTTAQAKKTSDDKASVVDSRIKRFQGRLGVDVIR
jgi:hypothetical protein